MIYIDEIKDLKLYKRKFLLPRNGLDKLKGNVVMLLTPNQESSKNIINHKLMINKYYKSYWLEKDVSFYINHENTLSHMDHVEYVHETVEGDWENILNEGVFTQQKQKIIYNGYKSDVDRARRFVSTSTISECNKELGIRVKYPISVTIYSKFPDIETNAKSIVLAGSIESDIDFEYHCKEEIYTMLFKSLNPDVNKVLLESSVMVMAGTYDKYRGLFNNDNIPYKFWCEGIKGIISKPGGYKELVKIIKNNEMTKLAGSSYDNNVLVKTYLKEAKMDPVAKLKRYITYSSHKGSEHILNKTNRNIEDTVDPTVSNPEFKENNDIAKKEREKFKDDEKDIIVPTIDASKSSFTPQNNGTQEDEKNESYQLNDMTEEYVLTEDFLRTKEGITYFIEASNTTNAKLRKMLYRERLRTNKDVIYIYDDIKASCPNIKNTFLNLNRYKGKNLIVDLRYYNELFFKNNMYKMDKGIDLYFTLLSRMINNDRLKKEGYNKKKVVFIPVNDWDINPNTKMWLYNKDINPVSMFYRLMQSKFYILKDTFDDTDFVFITDTAYFKINFKTFKESDKTMFLNLIKRLRSGNMIEDEGNEPTDSQKAIMNTIIDNIEDSNNIKIYNLTGDANKDDKPANDKDEINDKNKQEIIDTVEKVSKNSNSVEDAMKKLDEDEYFKKILVQLASEEDDTVKLNSSRTKRMETLNNDFLKKKVYGKTVQEILDEKKELNSKNLEKTAIPIDSINKEWQELTYINASKMYDPADDIVAMLYSLRNKSYPLSVRDIEVTDTSTSEDYVYTYAVDLESHTGKRFKIKFDIPKIKDGYYMMLRGNRKVISSQSFLMPVLKSDEDAAQIVSNYSKIFIYRFGSSVGKSNVDADKLIKTLSKNEFKGVTITTGDNVKICSMYDVPIDYIDLASVYSKIETPRFIFYFNQKEIRETYKDKIDLSKGLPIGYDKNTKEIEYYPNNVYYTLAGRIASTLMEYDGSFAEAFRKATRSSKYMYSKASILSTEIPVIVLTSYSEGLVKVMEKAGIKYELVEKRPRADQLYDRDIIKFSDGYLIYDENKYSSMLMNGLKECNTEAYSIGDINSKSMYLDFLDSFGGRIKADGIENFYDCMIDPITEDVLEHYGLPNDYVSLLIHGSNLLTDNKYYKHGDQSPRRIRRNEIIAGYTYKALTQSYGKYAIDCRHGRDNAMTIKQSSIIDLILLDPTSSDSSFINPLAEAESYNTVSTKGLSGMNSDRSYGVDKRSYDESMINVLGMSTSFAGNVGINRQATINANIATVRGYVQPSKKEDMNSVNSLCITEALTPMGTTRDDPFRTAMTFIQTSKHNMRVRHSDPCLVTNGASAALPYLISDNFAYKAKNNGEIVEYEEDNLMVIKYNDGSYDYINLSDRIEKNSAAGFYQIIKLDTDYKLGQKVKKNDIVAYDKLSFNGRNGMNNDLEYNIGTLCKCAMLVTDEGFEDSAIISDALSEALTSDVVVKKEINIPKDTNVYKLLEAGTPVEEGDTLMIMQSSFSDEDANALLKTLVDDPEEISNLGRIQIKSKVTGKIQAVEVYRTVELDELSDSLKKICKKFEGKIAHKKSIMKKYNIDKLEELPPDYKLEATGNLKGTIDGVQIVFYLAYTDKMSVGDKLVYWSANKGVVKGIFPKGKEPYALSEPNEKLHTLLSIDSANGRMITSIQNVGIIQNLLVEMTKKAKDMAGISYDYNKLD